MEFVFKFIEAIFGRFQEFFKFICPARVGEVACADDRNAFQSGPEVEELGSQVFACCQGEVGMDMEVGNKFHFS